MPQTIFELPQTNIATAREFMDLYESNEKGKSSSSTLYTRSEKQPGQYFPKSNSISTSGWENFRNELEFE